MKKKIISLFLAVVMIAGMLPLGAITAFAAELNWEGIKGNRLNESWFGTKDGMYILLDNGDSSGQWSSINRVIEIKEGVTVTIDMNGSILKSNVDGPLFDVYGTLILKNAGENNSHPAQAALERADNEKNKSNLITVHSTGRVDIIDSGNGANGIDIKNSHSDSYGGAVFVIGNNGVGGTFNLYDPKTKIFDCDENDGGGVYVQQYATFNMYAGTISGCEATNNSNTGGGGVFNQGTFNMYGGTISNCSSNLYGGGVFNGGTFNMYGGTIDGCKSVNGGGVLNKGTFNMYGAGTYNSTTTSGAVIQNCESTGTNGLGGAIFAGTNSTTVIDGGLISGCKSSWLAGGVYQTDASVVTLKSGTVSNCSASGNGGGFYTDHRSTLNITGGEITGCTSGNNGGGVFLVRNDNDKDTDTSKYTTLNMSGGTISECTANMHGGGVCATQLFGKVKFNMTGGKIENCTSTNGNGGGVSLHNGAEFIMSGGTIQGNKTLSTASGNGMGGGVFDDGTFAMSNGIIQNNSASRWGGGVQTYNNGTFTMTGGSIINNTAVDGAGGVNCNKTATIQNATITGNRYTGGESGNNGHQLRAESGKGTITIKDYCTIDNGTNDLSDVTNNITKTAITFDKQGGNGGSDSVDPAYNSAMPAVTVPTLSGSMFLGYFDAQTGGTKYYNADGTSAKNWDRIVASTTLYAQWNKDWTLLIGETDEDGKTIESGYYYVNADTLCKATEAGKSGLNIAENATVYLYIPAGVTLTCTGADASGKTGGGAGIYLPESATLHIYGEGTLKAQGGNAAAGGAGNNGDDGWAYGGLTSGGTFGSGSGGAGGVGGGGAGAGIGTPGGLGGDGGAKSSSSAARSFNTTYGYNAGCGGNAGKPGSAAAAMGTLYLEDSLILDVVGGGASETQTAGGSAGTNKYDSNNGGVITWSMNGGAGGGAGGNGYPAGAIGTGGAGGGGGGGGSSPYAATNGSNSGLSGNASNDKLTPYATGGAGGKGYVNGANGETNDKQFWRLSWDWNSTSSQGWRPNDWPKYYGGAAGEAGGASVAYTSDTSFDGVTFNITYLDENDAVCGTDTYTVGSTLTVTLPDYKPGYAWRIVGLGTPCGPDSDFTSESDETFHGTVGVCNVYGDLVFKADLGIYDIKLNLNGGECEELTSYIYSVGATLPIPTKKDYNFGGWYDNAGFNGEAITEIGAEEYGDKEFYAKWNGILPDVSAEDGNIVLHYNSYPVVRISVAYIGDEYKSVLDWESFVEAGLAYTDINGEEGFIQYSDVEDGKQFAEFETGYYMVYIHYIKDGFKTVRYQTVYVEQALPEISVDDNRIVLERNGSVVTKMSVAYIGTEAKEINSWSAFEAAGKAFADINGSVGCKHYTSPADGKSIAEFETGYYAVYIRYEMHGVAKSIYQVVNLTAPAFPEVTVSDNRIVLDGNGCVVDKMSIAYIGTEEKPIKDWGAFETAGKAYTDINGSVGCTHYTNPSDGKSIAEYESGYYAVFMRYTVNGDTNTKYQVVYLTAPVLPEVSVTNGHIVLNPNDCTVTKMSIAYIGTESKAIKDWAALEAAGKMYTDINGAAGCKHYNDIANSKIITEYNAGYYAVFMRYTVNGETNTKYQVVYLTPSTLPEVNSVEGHIVLEHNDFTVNKLSVAYIGTQNKTVNDWNTFAKLGKEHTDINGADGYKQYSNPANGKMIDESLGGYYAIYIRYTVNGENVAKYQVVYVEPVSSPSVSAENGNLVLSAEDFTVDRMSVAYIGTESKTINSWGALEAAGKQFTEINGSIGCKHYDYPMDSKKHKATEAGYYAVFIRYYVNGVKMVKYLVVEVEE